jgi:hypothetical protein
VNKREDKELHTLGNYQVVGSLRQFKKGVEELTKLLAKDV